MKFFLKMAHIYFLTHTQTHILNKIQYNTKYSSYIYIFNVFYLLNLVTWFIFIIYLSMEGSKHKYYYIIF